MVLDLAIMVIDLIGVVAFIIALYFSAKNYSITSFASSIWWVFSVLCGLAIIWIIFLLIGSPIISVVAYAFLVGFISCFLFLSFKENIKLF